MLLNFKKLKTFSFAQFKELMLTDKVRDETLFRLKRIFNLKYEEDSERLKSFYAQHIDTMGK